MGALGAPLISTASQRTSSRGLPPRASEYLQWDPEGESTSGPPKMYMEELYLTF